MDLRAESGRYGKRIQGQAEIGQGKAAFPQFLLPHYVDTLFLKPTGPLSNFRRLTAAGTRAGACQEAGYEVVSQAPAPPLPAAAGLPAAPAPAVPPGVALRAARREEVSVALRVILGSSGHLADDAQVLDFMQFALRRGINLGEAWLAEDTSARKLLWAVLPVVSPGRTLLLLGPTEPPARHYAEIAPIAEALVERACANYGARGVQLAQVLLDPADALSRRIYESRGFGPVAQLLYLQGSPRRKTAAPALPAGFAWVTYDGDTHDRFASTISQTYQHSLDCPSLNGLRDIEDVLAGHKATGQFDPALWMMLKEDSAGPVTTLHGVLLLARVQQGDALELVYLGLTPASRGRGLGDLLVRQALATVAAERLSHLTLAVDARNTPALMLYYRHGLQQVATKLALMRQLDGAAAVTAPQPAGAPPASAGAPS